jgi:diguanylate cyclase (GGDEF)-like protein/PAS domain S-box-containing protein
MNWIYTPFAAILHLTAIISAFVGYLVFRRRKTPGALAAAVLLFITAEAAFASGMEVAGVGLQNKIIWAKLEYLGVISIPTLFFVFVLGYIRQEKWLTRNNLILLSIIPLAGLIAAVTNWHGLIWNKFTVLPDQPNMIIYGHGTGYFILIIYDYLIISAGIVLLLRLWLRSKATYRSHIGILLLGSAFPFIGGVLYNAIPGFLSGLDLVPVCFSITGLVIGFGILKFRLFDLVPIARDKLIDSLDEGILVLDVQNSIVDVNPIAQNMIGLTADEIIGRPAGEILKSWDLFSRELKEKLKGEAEFHLYTDPPRHIHMHSAPLYDPHGDISGNLIVLRDITQRHQMEMEHARTIEELSIINNISLSITAGLDMEHVLKALHEQCNQVAPMNIFYVALYDEASSLIHVPIFFENGHYEVGPSRDITEHPGIIGSVIKARKTLVLNNPINPDTRPLPVEQTEMDKPPRSYIGIPLMVRERVIGVMSIQSYHPNAFNNDHVRILEKIAIQAAIAIENAHLFSEVQRLAIIDELTGVYNYRGLQELGTREVERAVRFHRALSILFFDVDNFRSFNNTYNHLTGNIILQHIARKCRTMLRSVDILTRFGGDEFVVLLPEIDITNAEVVARRMVKEIGSETMATSFGELSVTISIGVAELTDDQTSLSVLIDRANRAEHQAKLGQKGIVVVAP